MFTLISISSYIRQCFHRRSTLRLLPQKVLQRKQKLCKFTQMDYAENYLNSMTKMTHAMNRTSLERFKALICSNRVGDNLALDIGCGDGSSTIRVLKPFLGSDVELEASDISESMIKHAIEKHGNQGVKFFVWDVLDEIPVRDVVARYNHVYSFLCLHYCQDLRKALKNVHSVLKPGGTFFFTMMLKLPFYETFKKLSRYPVWAPYLNDGTISRYSAPLQFEKDPETLCRKLMTECGFIDVQTNFGIGKMAMDTWEQFAGFGKFGDRFMDRLPEYLRDQYLHDYLHEMKLLENFVTEKVDRDGKTCIELQEKFYTFIICHAIKNYD